MSRKKLFQMANQIATFFESQPQGDAADKVAAHLSDFWEPGMRAEFIREVDRDPSDLRPLAVEAAGRLKEHKAKVEDPEARPTLPGEKAPGPGGWWGSDEISDKPN